jgi:uncharacterized protein (DUF362 family)
MTVSLVKFDKPLNSVRRAIELCGGFDKLSKTDRVLIKPNNCFRHRIMPPYGMVTTAILLEGIVQLLIEYGCRDISIGEGAIVDIFDELGPLTKQGFKGSAIERIARRYGIKLFDFNRSAVRELDLGGFKVQASEAALDTDFLINVPVLKTHFQSKVSLGFKNLKGCLSQDSKKRFHSSKLLGSLICRLNEAIESDLVIIDGIYMLEKGPETLVGTAHRKDLVIASCDAFECDIVGSTILGIAPLEVDYLAEYARRNGRSFDISAVQIKGEDIESLKEHLEWRFEPDKELLTPARVTGVSAPYPGQTLCSACGATLALALSIFAKDNAGMDFGAVELLYGLETRLERDVQKAILYGKCAVARNKDLQDAIRVGGCPPTLTMTLLALTKALLSRRRMTRVLLLRFLKLVGIRLGLYRETFPGWQRYRSKEFDKRDF